MANLKTSNCGTAINEINAVSTCLNDANGNTLNAALMTHIASKEQEIYTISSQQGVIDEELAVSKARTERLTRPEANTSYYEGWFPIDKPLHVNSIPVLIACSILFFTIFMGTLMTSLGIQIGFSPITEEMKRPDQPIRNAIRRGIFQGRVG